jgi:hypothetical protein
LKGLLHRPFNEIKGLQELHPQTVLIKEPDVLRLIMASKKPEAEPFQDWVFEEVLPEIRRTGSYSFNAQQHMLAVMSKSIVEMAEAITKLTIQFEEFKEPSKFKGLPSKNKNTYFDVGSLSDYISEEFKIKIGRNKIYDYFRQLNWIENNSTMPTFIALHLDILNIDACVIQYEDGTSGKAVRTMINKSKINKFIEFLQLQNIIPNYQLVS